MPCYNSVQWLARALKSLEEQTFKNFEVICVDDCSSDGTYEYLENYKANSILKICLLQNEQNCGPGLSRNRALEEACGEYVTFLDSDDWYEFDYLNEVYNKLQNTQADIIFSDFYRDFDIGKRRVINWTSVFSEKSIKNDYIALCYDSLCVMAIRKRLFDEINLPMLYNAEDTAMCPLLVARALNVTYISKPLYHYLCRSKSLSTRIDERVYQSFDLAYQFLVKNISASYHDELVFRGVRMIMYGVVYNAIRAGVPTEKFEYIVREFQNRNPDYLTNPYIKTLPIRKRFFIWCVAKKWYRIIAYYCWLQNLLLRIN